MLLGPFELLSQWTATDGKSHAILQDVNFRQWITLLPGGEIKNIKPGDYVKPWLLNGLWTLVPAKFYPKTSEHKEETEKTGKPAIAKKQTPPSSPSDKNDGEEKKN